jgi:hypothetical protein
VIWNVTFEQRLSMWRGLRDSVQDLDLPASLLTINDWWWNLPMVNHSLSWQDPLSWPDPWDLINLDGFCGLARALGMLYTVRMLPRSDIHDLVIVQVADDNLVHVNQAKYIMNWCPGDIVNIRSQKNTVRRTLDSNLLQQKLG